MFEPQSLPGRYGRVIAAIDRLLNALDCQAVVGGGWAVWRHGYVGRVTQDVDIILPADHVPEFLQVASVSGFQVLPTLPHGWPKMLHKETGVQVDILPEGERPGVPPEYAPTTIPSPAKLGARGASLQFIALPSLVELKLAAGRLKDQADVVELIRANRGQITAVRDHLASVHPRYVADFEQLIKRLDSDDATR